MNKEILTTEGINQLVNNILNTKLSEFERIVAKDTQSPQNLPPELAELTVKEVLADKNLWAKYLGFTGQVCTIPLRL